MDALRYGLSPARGRVCVTSDALPPVSGRISAAMSPASGLIIQSSRVVPQLCLSSTTASDRAHVLPDSGNHMAIMDSRHTGKPPLVDLIEVKSCRTATAGGDHGDAVRHRHQFCALWSTLMWAA